MTVSRRAAARLGWLFALSRGRCPRCHQGKIFRGVLTMNERCPVCGLLLEREEGYFLGAMYISYPLSGILLGAGLALGTWIFPNWDLTWVLFVVAVPLFLPMVPAVFRYSRILWIYLDRWIGPTELSTPQGWAKTRPGREHKPSEN